MKEALAMGLDIGTSGVRCVALDSHGETVATANRSFQNQHDARDPATWAAIAQDTLADLLKGIDRDAVRAIAVDGTSGTLLAVDAAGSPVSPPLMYNDSVTDPAVFDHVCAIASAESAARSATSGLAKALVLQEAAGIAHLVHQADWIAAQFCGRWDISDENNALKTGYDPVERCWSKWIAATGLRTHLLPAVVPPGTPIAVITPGTARRLNLPRDMQVIAGTTDGCASFLASGASEIGDAVTALGSSLTLKILSDRPISSPVHGIYSHRLGNHWLAGGASNTGGSVLASFFNEEALASLSQSMDPERTATLNYYPLLRPGERFPVADPAWPPRLSPRPSDDAEFLHELLAGIASIEHQGYACLTALGCPALRSIRSVGGGARNEPWTAMRERLLGVPFLPVRSVDAAAGAARLALQGLRERETS